MGKIGVHSSNFIDMTGWKMWEHGVPDSKIIVIEQVPRTQPKKIYWKCKCACGNPNEFIVQSTCLRSGNTLSCGCVKRDRHPSTHGDSNSKLYYVWSTMRKRCNNPNDHNYNRYGGRGITVCNEWNNYQSFRDWAMSHGYKEGLEIERNDNNGNYCPENCRWATHQEQCCNRSSNVRIEYQGSIFSAQEFSQLTGLTYETILARVRNGWSSEEIFNTPYRIKRKAVKHNEED